MPRFVTGLFFLVAILSPTFGEEAPISPSQAPAKMRLPDGFHVNLVAGEPELIKPIAITTDDRGRLWVVESHSYPNWITDGRPGHDRVLIFEERDGRFTSKVFWDQGTNLSGIAVGFGGVWLCATPNFLFIPLKPNADEAAGPPQVLLDGWDLNAKHNVFNSLTWGPDGWLYGCNGITSNSRVGKPGTPANERVALNCSVWRFHPVRKTFETFAWGTTNPWGLDFDDYGEMFITNCVIKHLFHVIPGAHFVRMFGQDLNPHCYGLMESCADHLHWGGGNWTSSRGGLGAHNTAGGGHAHAGALVYLGANWPAQYRNHIFMCNLHGNRLNQDLLERHGSGYVAHHGADFLMANDTWFRGLALQAAADGGVFVSDWHDTGECHSYKDLHPCGRIFKVSYGEPKTVATDLAKKTDIALVELQLNRDDWWVRHARRLLLERAQRGALDESVAPRLWKILDKHQDITRRLRALWALYCIGALRENELIGLTYDPREAIRAWAIRLAVEKKAIADATQVRLATLARNESAATVRLALASALQRLPAAQRWGIARGLVAHAEDATDANLPFMIWYGIEAAIPTDADMSVKLLAECRIPLVREYITRRLAESTNGVEAVTRFLAQASSVDVQRDILRGLDNAFQGQRSVSAPTKWAKAYDTLHKSADAEIRERSLYLAVLFGDKKALAALRETATNPTAPLGERRNALLILVSAHADNLAPLLRGMLTDRVLRGEAVRALAAANDPGSPTLILKHYDSFTESEKADAIATLVARAESARTLLDAVEHGRVPRRDLTAFNARQIVNLKDHALTEKLTKVWGNVRPAAQSKTALLHRYLSLVPPAALVSADRSHGRVIFARTCATCHTLFGEGAKIGPDLTGSQRTNPEYVLTKVLDPSATVARDYQMVVIVTTQGRTLNGIIKEETEKTLALQTQTELVRLSKADIDARTHSGLSMMPEGMLTPLADADIRDLIAYLAGSGQVALPKGKLEH